MKNIIDRSGQKNPCTVIRLTGSSMEKRLYKALENKENIQHNIMTLYNDILS